MINRVRIKNIYADEYDLEEELAEQIDREEYSLSDYPGEDGVDPEYMDPDEDEYD